VLNFPHSACSVYLRDVNFKVKLHFIRGDTIKSAERGMTVCGTKGFTGIVHGKRWEIYYGTGILVKSAVALFITLTRVSDVGW
jgi:hypothetical protein